MHDEPDPVGQDQLCRSVELVRADRMRDRLVDLALLEVPRAGPMMQGWFSSGLKGAKLAHQQLPEQSVEPIPLASLIERDDESVGATQATQDSG